MRNKFICGNWKMNGSLEETRSLLQGLLSGWSDDYRNVEVAVCPPFTALMEAQRLLLGSPIQLGAQNANAEKSGAFTGEVSPVMLSEIGCSYVILGHSERRTIYLESSEAVSRKVKGALAFGLKPILCIGETLEERERGITEFVLLEQLRGSLAGVSAEQLASVTLAYEPVWAIGTGKTATPEQAQIAHAFIRAQVEMLYSKASSENIRIQYGGSMKPDNALELLSSPDIDGGLIGGAALQAASFLAIVAAAASASQ
ncbi:MAG: triose-phosphate isomerase [Candidatus Kapaibacterium sp.]|jgi:triosephosphate isomerase